MFIDRLLCMSIAQAVTASAAPTDAIDLGAIRNIGVGEGAFVVCLLRTAMTDTGSDSTVTVTLRTDDNSAFSSATTRQTIGAFAATSAAGTRIYAPLQPDVINERYLQGYYTVAGGDLSGGTFDLFITKDVQAFTSYATGFSISA